METLLQDLRYGVRCLIRQPGFTLVTVVTLALGIGANTTIFSVVYSVLLRPLPFDHPERIVLLWGDDRAEGDKRSQVSHTDIVDYRTQQSTFEAISTYTSWRPLISGSGFPERIGAALVGDDFFKVLGAQPQLGRVFLSEEQLDGKDQVVILSDQVWRQRFNSDPSIIGKSILLNLRPHVVVGVMPPDFASLPSSLIAKPALLYRPVAESFDEKQRSARHLRAIGRLKDGVSMAQAQSDLKLIAQRLEKQHPESNTNWGIYLVGIHADYVRDLKRSLWFLLGAVAVVLLIACANVANLLLARSTMRASEIGIRTALGASRWRLLRQSLTESALLALSGAAAGFLLAVWGVDLVRRLGGTMLPQLQNVQLSWPALTFTLALSLFTGIAFGLVPALQSAKSALKGALKIDGKNLGSDIQKNRLRGALVVSEIALALVLLMCAGLLIQTVRQLQRVDSGFNYTNVLKMDLGLPSLKYPTDESRIAFYSTLAETVSSLPGISSAAAITPLPAANGFDTTSIEVEGQPEQPGQEPSADRYVMTPGYLDVLGIPLRRGRGFSKSDMATATQVMLVSQSLADRFWPNQDPIGKRIRLPWNPGREDEPWRTVIGVVSDVKQYGPDKPSSIAIYLPHAQYPVSFMTLVAKSSGSAAETIPSVRRAVQTLDPDQVPIDAATMEQVIADSIQTRRFSMVLLGVFSGLALALAAVGIYGVMSYAVAQRTHELGIRIALGAQSHDVFGLILRNTLMLAISGIAIGTMGVFGATRLLKGLLFGVAPTDLATLLVVSAGLILVALIACYLPARRATKVDPLVALRRH